MANFFDLMISKLQTPFYIKADENEVMAMIKEGIEELTVLFHTSDFIDSNDIQQYLDKYKDLNYTIKQILNTIPYKLHLKKNEYYNQYIEWYAQVTDKMHNHNEHIATKKSILFDQTLNPVEGRNLDEQQVKSIVKESHNHLVLAGAGTGKTTTIVGLIKYLLFKGYQKEDILVLSYTNTSAIEMRERIQKECNCRMDISTFHKLGLNIITEVDGKRPVITKLNLQRFVSDRLKVFIQDKDYFNKLVHYLANYNIDYKSEFDFQSEKEYKEYLDVNPPMTYDHINVKSHGERLIANFLFQNGIQYEYEKAYEIDTRDQEHSQYYPDFYLPEYNIYIEYYAVDIEGHVPSYFEGVDPSKKYNDSIKWKRKIHKKNHTTLIECYAFEHFDGVLLDNLELKLSQNGVQLSPIDTLELWRKITSNENKAFSEISLIFSTIITLVKNNNCTFEEVRSRNYNKKHIKGNNLALDLIEPIYNDYQSYLSSHNEIDFNDMINLAITYINNNQYRHHYQYVVIDEYQDISQSRYQLIHAMREQKDFKLFCVGDDWQSIYRFNGSDIGFILNFEKYWGITEISRIESTYRFNQRLCDLSSKFIMNNQEQSKKYLKSKIEYDINPVTFLQCNDMNRPNVLAKTLDKAPDNGNILLLGRYNFDIEPIRNSILFECRYDNVINSVKVKYKNREDLNIIFQTIHASKGLQADYVFILNNKRFGMGFPSTISNPPVLELLLDNSDHYPYGEERRLFYVALTRAKKKVFLLVDKGNESIFVKELYQYVNVHTDKKVNVCPKCGGKLIYKKGKYGPFLGCSNYSKAGCTYKQKLYIHK